MLCIVNINATIVQETKEYKVSYSEIGNTANVIQVICIAFLDALLKRNFQVQMQIIAGHKSVAKHFAYS